MNKILLIIQTTISLVKKKKKQSKTFPRLQHLRFLAPFSLHRPSPFITLHLSPLPLRPSFPPQNLLSLLSASFITMYTNLCIQQQHKIASLIFTQYSEIFFFLSFFFFKFFIISFINFSLIFHLVYTPPLEYNLSSQLQHTFFFLFF